MKSKITALLIVLSLAAFPAFSQEASGSKWKISFHYECIISSCGGK
ncbi:MAG: hypothetical protein IPN43_11535 [Chitinophagaceae bacterium]|nr:hypothetical protein [Chitinophagaceae bacterium]